MPLPEITISPTTFGVDIGLSDLRLIVSQPPLGSGSRVQPPECTELTRPSFADSSPESVHMHESRMMSGWSNPDNEEGVGSFLEKVRRATKCPARLLAFAASREAAPSNGRRAADLVLGLRLSLLAHAGCSGRLRSPRTHGAIPHRSSRGGKRRLVRRTKIMQHARTLFVG